MNRVLHVLLVVVVCLPMLFVAWLLFAVHSPKMDALTMRGPYGVRRMVALAITQKAAWDDRPKYERAVRLDPESAVGWDGLCSAKGVEKDAATELENCRKAERFSENAGDYSVIGQAQEKLGDPCGAAESYRKASVMATGGWSYLDEMGQAALHCGDLWGARAAFEAAIALEAKTAGDKDEEEDSIKAATDARLDDQEYLIVTYDRMKQPELAKQTCTAAHPDWHACTCALGDDGTVECEERKR